MSTSSRLSPNIHRLLNTLHGVLLTLLISSCSLFERQQAGIGEAVDWDELPGWSQDRFTDALPALLSQCGRLAKQEDHWRQLCSEADALQTADDIRIRQWFESRFQPHEILGDEGVRDGLITGYYEPTLHGSLQPDDEYRHPLYGRPESLLIVDLGELYPSLKNQRVRGRLIGNRVVPYFDRAEIDGQTQPLKGQELLWVNDPYAAFFLQIQGSGRVVLPDGRMVAVGYADQNGHQYVSIGKKLVEWGELTREEASLFTIRKWLELHPERARELLNQNPSYVFFTLNEKVGAGPFGSLNVPLTPQRSLAVDRSVIPLGTPVWLSTTLPSGNTESEGAAYQRLLFAQDTGGAINGAVRADLFFGNGPLAEQLAGTMKQPGRLYALLPRTPQG